MSKNVWSKVTLAYRLGGDEYLVLVPGSDLESAVTLVVSSLGSRSVLLGHIGKGQPNLPVCR